MNRLLAILPLMLFGLSAKASSPDTAALGRYGGMVVLEYGYTHRCGASWGLGLAAYRIFLGVHVTRPSLSAQGEDYTTVVGEDEYLDQQQGRIYDDFAGTCSLSLGFRMGRRHTAGLVIGEGFYRDQLQYYGPMMGSDSRYYHISTDIRTRFDYGLFYACRADLVKNRLALMLTARWTLREGWGASLGAGYVF